MSLLALLQLTANKRNSIFLSNHSFSRLVNMCNGLCDSLTPVMNDFRKTRLPPTPALRQRLSMFPCAQTRRPALPRLASLEALRCSAASVTFPRLDVSPLSLRQDGTWTTQMECDRVFALFPAPIDPLNTGACHFRAANPGVFCKYE